MAFRGLRVVVCAAGLKGAQYIERISMHGVTISEIFSYRQIGDASNAFEKIKSISDSIGAEFQENRRPRFQDFDLVFVVGWQYLLEENQAAQIVVFHDSILPSYRGFSPTVNALIAGEPRIGVTALVPTDGIDEGPIILQDCFEVRYPLKIAEALKRQADLMAQMTPVLVELWITNGRRLPSRAQNNASATYSLWRDCHDYRINWSLSATTIVRTIDAVGFPYEGARSLFDGSDIIIDEAKQQPDLNFVQRAPGKIWRLDAGRPVVVCGEGLLRVDAARMLSDRPVVFSKIRSRFG